MKGIILAGGSGTRLFPVTQAVSKQLMPVYDKPMVYYPLSALMLAGIQDILLISTPADTPRFKQLLGDGSQWGLRLSYAVQPEPNGLAEAFLIGRDFLAGSACCLVLGDNIFYGHDFARSLRDAAQATEKSGCAHVFAYPVTDPERYGVVAFDAQRPDVNCTYLASERLNVEVLGRGIAWLDTGTHDSLLEATLFIHTIEKRQGLKVACPEEISYRLGWITEEALTKIANNYGKSSYGDYLRRIVRETVY